MFKCLFNESQTLIARKIAEQIVESNDEGDHSNSSEPRLSDIHTHVTLPLNPNYLESIQKVKIYGQWYHAPCKTN